MQLSPLLGIGVTTHVNIIFVLLSSSVSFEFLESCGALKFCCDFVVAN